MKSKLKTASISKSIQHANPYMPHSIKRIEERPELNNYIQGKPVSIRTEPPVLKQSLAEHLANPYIYIEKVLNKNKAREHFYEHPEEWVTSCNPTSLRHPVTRGREHSPENEKNTSPGKSQSPKRLTTQQERREHYEENANQRAFVNNFFETIYQNVWSRNQMEGQLEDEMKGSAEFKKDDPHVDPTDLRKLFAQFSKEKKLTFNKKDEDKYVSDKHFADFVKYCMRIDLSKEDAPRREVASPTKSTKSDNPQEEKIGFDYDIDKFFKYFAENKGGLTNNTLKISVKAFMYNYKKHIEKKHKIMYILSEKAARQRNIDIKIYIKDFLAAFDDIKSHLAQIKEKETNIYSSIVAYDMAGKPEHGVSLIEVYNKLIEEKENLLFDRKVLVRFLELRNKRYPDTLVEFVTLNDLMYKVLREDKSADLSMLGGFIHEFKREKQLFKEDQFNLFEMVNFIHEKKYSRAQFEIISHFIARLRKAYNVYRNTPKDQYVDPRTPFANSFLSTTFEALCKKAERQSDFIEGLIRDLEQEYERYRGPEATARTNRIIEFNVVGDFILKRFTYMDNRLLEVLDKLEELGNYLTQEEADQIPMEEVRRRVYQIITGQELREHVPQQTKKLEGFKNLLKGMKSGERGEERREERRDERREVGFKDVKTGKGGKDEKDDHVNRLLFEKEKEFNEREKARVIEYEKEREREKDKARALEIEQDRKKAKAEKDEWDWEAAINGGGNERSVVKNYSDVKEKDDELDNFISLLNDKQPATEKSGRGLEESYVLGEDKDKYGSGLARYQKMMAAESDGFSKFRPQDPKSEEKNKYGNGLAQYQRMMAAESDGFSQNKFRPEDLRSDEKNKYGSGLAQYQKMMAAESDGFSRFKPEDQKSDKKNPLDSGLARYQRMMAAESDGFSQNKPRSLRPEDLKSEEKKVVIKDVNLDQAPTFKSAFLDTLKGLKMLNDGDRSDIRFESPEEVKNAILKKNERLSKTLENVQDANFLTKSTLKGRTDDAVVIPDTVNLGKDKPKMGRYSDYEMLMPPDYYTFLAKKNVEMDKDPWYIRSHHIETLTEHPKSVKDNLLGAEYMSYYSALPKDEKVTAKEKEIVGYSDKENLIKSLEENRKRLKEELEKQKLQRDQHQLTMSSAQFRNSKGFKEVSKYYDTREVKEGPELMVRAYEGILDDLRNQEKALLISKRTEKLTTMKPPPHKWWELKDKTFIDEYIKHVFMTGSDTTQVDEYIKHVEELQLRELI